MEFANVKSIEIPEGIVIKVIDKDTGQVLWERENE